MPVIVPITPGFAPTTGSLSVDFGTFKAKLADSAYADLQATFPAFGVRLQSWNIGSLSADLGRFAVRMSDGIGSRLTAAFPSFTVEMESDLLIPQSARLTANVGDFTFFGTSLTGEVGSLSVNLGRFKVKAADSGGYSDLTAALPSFAVYLRDVNMEGGLIVGSGLLGTALVNAEVLPAYFSVGIRATGLIGSAVMNGGSRIRARGLIGSAALTVTSSGYNTIRATGLIGSAAITGLSGSVGSIAATGLIGSAVVYSGARIVASGLIGSAAITGKSGTVAAITAKGLLGTAAVTGYAGTAISITATGILGVATSGNVIAARGLIGRALIIANETSYVVADAYTVTLNNPKKPVTRFTHYGFHSIVRRGSQYLAFGPAGAFALSGTDDAGTAIEWSVQFGPTVELPGNEYGQGIVKDNTGVYVNGRFTEPMELAVAVDDDDPYAYVTTPPKDGADTLRFVPGRGLRGIAWQYTLSGSGPMTLYRAEFLQRSLKRKVKHG